MSRYTYIIFFSITAAAITYIDCAGDTASTVPGEGPQDAAVETVVVDSPCFCPTPAIPDASPETDSAEDTVCIERAKDCLKDYHAHKCHRTGLLLRFKRESDCVRYELSRCN